jgi:hypothetical protein
MDMFTPSVCGIHRHRRYYLATQPLSAISLSAAGLAAIEPSVQKTTVLARFANVKCPHPPIQHRSLHLLWGQRLKAIREAVDIHGQFR